MGLPTCGSKSTYCLQQLSKSVVCCTRQGRKEAGNTRGVCAVSCHQLPIRKESLVDTCRATRSRALHNGKAMDLDKGTCLREYPMQPN